MMTAFVIVDVETGEYLDEKSIYRDRKIDGGLVYYNTYKTYRNGMLLSDTHGRAEEMIEKLNRLCKKYKLNKQFEIERIQFEL